MMDTNGQNNGNGTQNIRDTYQQGSNQHNLLNRSTLDSIAGSSDIKAIGTVQRKSTQDLATTPSYVDTSARWSSKPGALYSEGRYRNTDNTNGEIRAWQGRTIYGVAIGIIQLEVQIPMPPGDIGNATTFPFPVMYEGLGEIDCNWVVSTEPHPEVIKRSIAAAKRLELQGARAIIGNCGFFANYQPMVAEAISVPFFSSSLNQIPMVMNSIRPDQKVGVLSANGEKLQDSSCMKYCGVTDLDRVVIYGAEQGENMKKILANSDNYNLIGLETELVELAIKMVSDHPEIGGVVLECTEFPPHAFAIQQAIHLDVWDFTTMVSWMFAGCVRRPFTGWI